jgi:hypothetical protein
VRNDVPVAQLDRVTGYEPVGRGFESLQARHSKQPFEYFQAAIFLPLLLFKVNKKRPFQKKKALVPVVGLEPTRSHLQRILSPSRLPFRHTGKSLYIV